MTMTLAERIEWINKFRNACVKARSIIAETSEDLGNNISPEAIERVCEDICPWLYGKKNILLQLDNIEKHPTNGNMLNLNYILAHTPPIKIAGVAYRLKELTVEEIFKDGGINDF